MITKITWKDNNFIEEGTILDQTESDILFQSHYDNTVNWVPLVYITLDKVEVEE